MAIKFVTNQPAVYITDEKILAIADIQIGLEHELYKKGVVIHAQVDKFLRTLDRLIRTTKAERLLIVGDLKHIVPGISRREERELVRFFDHLTKKVEITVVKGNHDTGLAGLLPKSVKIYDGGGVKIGKYGFFHGHAWPDKSLMGCDHLFMGHLQPGVEFSNDIGYRATEQVWLKCRLDKQAIRKHYKIKDTGEIELTILPAFNKLLGSAPVNKMKKGNYRGPFTDGSLDVGKSKVYLLDGTFVGVLDKMDK
ncbi:MAG: metallophosphoesterase [Candidatus Aenigmarchaeota archaeon]|nr:metallophosphoesterase [Candidatus Aenigmarchaeota archaeon]